MRARLSSVLSLVVVLAACGRDEPARVPVARHAVESPGTRADASGGGGPSSYILVEPGPRDDSVRLKLNGGQLGVVIDGVRAILGRGEPIVATEESPDAIVLAARIPSRLGGGFLFHTDRTLYRAETFTGSLRPLARTPEPIEAISFASRSILVRARNGERWSIALPSGDRVAPDFPGVADVEALDDGRAVAFDDQGLAFTSVDGGAHWSEVTALLRTAPMRVANVRDELWLLESGGTAQRLEPDGRLAAFDAAPEQDEDRRRASDPRWRGTDTPLRTAYALGASLDETTALVYADGDIVKVDVRTGDLVQVAAGKLPPHAVCQAISTSTDVLFACRAESSGSGVAAWVASRTLSGEPVVEQTFSDEGVFWASDDGGLAALGTCSGASADVNASAPASSPASVLVERGEACVRQPDGSWRDVEMPVTALPAGAVGEVRRWVPRADGAAVALVDGQAPGIYDPQHGRFERIPEAHARALDGTDSRVVRPQRWRTKTASGVFAVVDRDWTLTSSEVLRGYTRGGSVEIAPGGRVTRSPFVVDVFGAGTFALGRTTDGRLFQTSDHGASWVEVAPPPTGSVRRVRGCSSVGCDLGPFLRVGWTARPPRPLAATTKARPAPDIRRVRAPELTCRPSGGASLKAATRTILSPDDLGLGATRLPFTDNHNNLVRSVSVRGIVHPVHDAQNDSSDGPAIRALVSGWRVVSDGDVPRALGPVSSIQALRRPVWWMAGFDPSGGVRRSTIAMSEVLTAGRAAGMTTDEILSEDMSEAGYAVVLTPREPTAPSDVALYHSRGLVALLRAGQERTRVAVRPPQNDALVTSGALLAGDEVALLELESGGPEHVFKVGPGGVTDLFDIGANLGDALFYPSNPDAVAIGPRGDVGVLRTGSGSEPASEVEPALVLAPGAKPVVLAPWSTLRLADDPACKADAGGWRATLQLVGPWVRSGTPDLRIEEGPMLARVRWSETRACLEGLELRVSGVNVRVPGESGSETVSQSTWIVGRGSSFARVGVGEGVEWRQPLECTLAPPPRP